MFLGTSSALALLFGLFLVGIPAWAGLKPDKVEKQCPHGFGEFDRIAQDIAKAPTCTAALELATSCSVVASSDVQLGAAVQERCERDFLARLGKAQKRAYQAEHERCERKYIREQGSMYRSFEAFCHAEVAQKYARRFDKAPRK